MNISQFQARLKLACSEGEVPSLRIRNGLAHYRIPYLVNLIEDRVSLEDVMCIGIFGSSARPPLYETIEQKHFFGLFTSKRRHQTNPTPRDLDVFVILWERANLKNFLENDEPLPIVERHKRADGYGWWWDSTLRSEGLHLLMVTASNFEKAVERGETAALSVLREGVIIAGELPENISHNLRQATWRSLSTCEI